jgi:hypothetical protein
MALIRSVLPSAIRKAMIEGLPRFHRPGDPPPSALVNAPAGQFYALRAFTLGLKDVQGPGIGRAKRAGWRVLVEIPPFPAVACVVTKTRPGGRPRMTSLFRGPQIAQVFLGARQLEFLPEVHAQDCNLQMLSIPGLLTEAFWLKSQGRGPDQMVPFYTVCDEIKLMRAYPLDTCMDIMRPLVDQFMSFGY